MRSHTSENHSLGEEGEPVLRSNSQPHMGAAQYEFSKKISVEVGTPPGSPALGIKARFDPGRVSGLGFLAQGWL